VAGNEMDESGHAVLKRKYNLLVGERRPSRSRYGDGSAYPLEKPLTMEVKGRNLIEGVPRTVHHRRQRNSRVTERWRRDHCERVRVALERTPPELSPTSATAG